MTEPILKLQNVALARGGRRIVEDINVECAPGSVVALVGPNGSGKTTILDSVSGIISPVEGSISIFGRRGSKMGTAKRVRHGLARTLQDSRLYCSLAVSDVAAIAGAHEPLQTLERAGLADRETAFAAELSYGNRRWVELNAVIDRSDCKLLVLDEPSAGLDTARRAQLARRLIEWCNETNGAVLMAEHDTNFIAQTHAATIEVSAASRNDNHTTATKLPSHEVEPRARIDLEEIRANADTEQIDLNKALPLTRLLRAGLRETAAGILAVLTVGVLNRVLKVELGIDLWVIGLILSAFHLTAPFAVAVGHRSDRRPPGHLSRTPWIIGGAVVSSVSLLAVGFVVTLLARDVNVMSVSLGVIVFSLIGAGQYVSGASFFALLADVTTPQSRARAAGVVYTMLFVGIGVGVLLQEALLSEYTPAKLTTLFVVASVCIVGMTTTAVWGLEPRSESKPATTSFRAGLSKVWAQPNTAAFVAFLFSAMFFIGLQQTVLEPFGGDVFNLSIAETTRFNAIQVIGVILGMFAAARLGDGFGHIKTAALGLAISSVTTAVLAFGAFFQLLELVRPTVFAIGLGLGLFTASGIALMMDTSVLGAVGVSMGIWTVARAAAEGTATALGGVVHTIGFSALGSESRAYGTVFLIQTFGIAFSILLLRRLRSDRLG